MNRSRNERDGNNGGNNGGNAGWWVFGAIAAGVTALAGLGLAVFLNSGSEATGSNTDSHEERKERNKSQTPYNQPHANRSSGSDNSIKPNAKGVPRDSIPDNPEISNINALINDIYVRYIAIKDDDFELYYSVFMDVFQRLHNNMKAVDPYYRKYSSTIQFTGSHYDNLRIDKPDEFDVNIVINLPINLNIDQFNPADSDIVFEPKSPGYIQLKTGKQFQLLPRRDDWDTNKTAYKWKDERNYLLRSEFTFWFKGVVQRALNRLNVPGYVLRTRDSGPAVTLIIENYTGFRCYVDMVPVFRFPKERWPICKGYRHLPAQCTKEWWVVVPKINKDMSNDCDQNRSWRVALHDQEKELLHNNNHMKQAIRLVKKLRDTQNMNDIASYYIKTLFYLEIIDRNDPFYWNQSPSVLFTTMVRRMRDIFRKEELPYFWHKRNNLIGHIKSNMLIGYANKMNKLLRALEDPAEYMAVAKFLLTPAELEFYNSRRQEKRAILF